MWDFFVQALGILAMVVCISSYQFKTSRGMMACKTTGDVIYIVHYLLLGAYSGCLSVAICALNGAFCALQNHKWARWRGWRWVLIALLAAACLYTGQLSGEWFSTGCTFVSIVIVILSTWTYDARTIRIAKLFGAGPTWLAYTLIYRSWGGALCEIFGMASSAIALIRYRKPQKTS